jgi:hypothetical protein
MGKAASSGANNMGGFMSDATGGGDVAKWGGRIAAEQQRVLRQYAGQANAHLNLADSQMKEATVSGLASLDRDIKNQERNLARQEQLISQIDPTIIEASQQALRLLKGEESSTLAPLKRQRMMQREKLLASLRQQMGPGAESSSAGLQALNRFDAETDNLFASGQQQALGNLGGLSAQFSSQRPDMLREIGGLSQFGQQQYGLRAGQANFNQGMAQNRMGIGQMLSGVAGAQWAGNLMNAQSRQQQLLAHQDDGRQIGRTFATMGMGGGGGGGNLAGKPQGGGGGELNASQNLQMPQLGSQYGG